MPEFIIVALKTWWV